MLFNFSRRQFCNISVVHRISGCQSRSLDNENTSGTAELKSNFNLKVLPLFRWNWFRRKWCLKFKLHEWQWQLLSLLCHGENFVINVRVIFKLYEIQLSRFTVSFQCSKSSTMLFRKIEMKEALDSKGFKVTKSCWRI